MVEDLGRDLAEMRASFWKRRLTVWLRDLGKVVYPYCYTTSPGNALYVHRPGSGVIAIHRTNRILRVEQVAVAEKPPPRDESGLTVRDTEQERRIKVHLPDRDRSSSRMRTSPSQAIKMPGRSSATRRAKCSRSFRREH